MKITYRGYLYESVDNKLYYHGSMDELPVGTILSPKDNYEENWGDNNFYQILEKYRPSNMLAHMESVFMCDNPDDIDAAGGGTDYLFTVVPMGKVERHDMNWGSYIESMISDGVLKDDPKIINAANMYWKGVPVDSSIGETLWEYLTPHAKILAVEEY